MTLIAQLWSAYWDFQMWRAAVVMRSLDAGTLAALGLECRSRHGRCCTAAGLNDPAVPA